MPPEGFCVFFFRRGEIINNAEKKCLQFFKFKWKTSKCLASCHFYFLKRFFILLPKMSLYEYSKKWKIFSNFRCMYYIFIAELKGTSNFSPFSLAYPKRIKNFPFRKPFHSLLKIKGKYIGLLVFFFFRKWTLRRVFSPVSISIQDFNFSWIFETSNPLTFFSFSLLSFLFSFFLLMWKFHFSLCTFL